MEYFPSFRWRSLSSFALLLLSVLLLAPLAACGGSTSTGNSNGSGGSSSNGPVTLTFASWVPGIDKAANLYTKSHPNVKINVESVPAGANGTYAKFLTEIQAKNAPDLGQVEYQFLPTFEGTGGLLDMSAYNAASIKSQFVPWTWNQVTQGSAVYAIPQDTGPMAMFYRADLFKKYGIAVPKTWDDYAAAAAKLHAANAQYYITDFPPKEAGQYIGYVWQAGSKWFRINGQSWSVGINDSSSKMVGNYWQSLLDKKLVKTDPDFSQAWYNDLQNGGAATWISAVWGANTILSNAPKTSGDWAVAPMPQWSAGQNVAGNWGGSTTVVFKNSQHPKEAADFAMWLNTNTDAVNSMVTTAQLYPALSSALNTSASDAVKTFYGGQDINSVFKDASNNVDVNFQWGPTMNQVFTDIGDNFSNATEGKTTLSASLDAVQASTVAQMKKQGFSVSS